jgi:MFS family permease
LARQTPDTALGEWRQSGLIVLAGAMGMALASTSVYSLGIFIAPLEAEFGWSRAEISAGLTINTVLSVLVSPFVGILLDRVGVRRIGIFGVVAYCLMFACLSFATASLWTWWGLWLLLGACGLSIKPTIWTTAVSSMFKTSRGLALSVMLCGTALGSSLTPVVGNYLIDAYGWRQGCMALAAFWGLLVIPPVALFLTSARDKQLRAEASIAPIEPPSVLTGMMMRDALRSWRFIRLALAGFVTTLVIVSFVSNLIPILSSRGFERQTAANLAGLVGMATIIGRLSGGFLLDRTNGNIVGAGSVGLAIIPALMLLLYPGSTMVAAAAVLILGLTLGSELDAVAYLATRHFGLKSFGGIFGTISGILAFGTGVGPFFVSLTYDLSKSYDNVLMAYIPLALLAAALFLSLGRYPDFDKPNDPHGHDDQT